MYVYHARVVCSDVRFGVCLAIWANAETIDSVRESVRRFYDAETVYLSYECALHERGGSDGIYNTGEQ